MKNEKLLFLKISVLVFVFMFSACQKNSDKDDNEIFQNSANSVSYSKIEDVDFKNFSYSYGKNDKYSFTLTNGEKPYGKLEDITFRLKAIQYTDLTNDNQNEAIINLFVGYGGSGTTSLIFIYTLENERPKKLWEISSGYNANGGLKEIYAKENILVIEFFGDTKFNYETNEFDFPDSTKFPQALCCPNNFTRLNFKWNGEKFVLVGNPKLFDYDWKNQTNDNLIKNEK